VVWNMAFTEPVMAGVKECVVGGSGVIVFQIRNPEAPS
jgi:hypothetical protein